MGAARLSGSTERKGLLTGLAFAVFYSVMGIPIARLADRWSRKHVLALAGRHEHDRRVVDCMQLASQVTAVLVGRVPFRQVPLVHGNDDGLALFHREVDELGVDLADGY